MGKLMLLAGVLSIMVASAEARRFVCTDGQVSLKKSLATFGDCDGDREVNGACVFYPGRLQTPGFVVSLGTHRRRRAVRMVKGQRTVFVLPPCAGIKLRHDLRSDIS